MPYGHAHHTTPAAGESASARMCLSHAPEEVDSALSWSRGGLGRDGTHVFVNHSEST
jgi:hypothetical protein